MKVCLATTEILGAHRNGGIGTATSHLALLLADGGHEVTLLNASNDRVEANSLWSSLYKRFGVRVVALSLDAADLEPWELRAPTAYYDHLWVRDFDVVIFQDWLGLAQACTTAKAAGLAFQDTLLVVNTHGSMQWVHDIARVSPSSRGKLRQIEIERRAVEQADVVISPSQYLVDWMRAAHWRLPLQTLVMQNFLDGFSLAGLNRARSPASAIRPHLVYFGRLERRKGVFLFLSALLAAPLAERRFALSFLGRESDLTEAALRDWVLEHRPELSPTLRVHTDKTAEEAMAFLRESRGLAVIPSYSDNSPCVIWECIEAGVPFISTLNGGIPELIPPEARARVLVQAEAPALASRLAETLDDASWTSVAHAQSPETVGRAWLSWLEGLQAPPAVTLAGVEAQPLTVILLDMADELALSRRLRELTLQTAAAFELIVVSERPEPDSMRSASAWITEPQPGLVAALRTAAAAASGSHVILATTTGQLSPALVKTLDTARRAFPHSAITAVRATADGADEAADLFTLRRPPRQAFAGGPLAVGAFDNVFGDLPLVLPRACLTDDVAWLPDTADTGWALLTAWTLAGREVVSLPIALSARASGEDLLNAREAGQREQTCVKRLYAQALPATLSDLVLCDLA